jgi:hypothetical protein
MIRLAHNNADLRLVNTNCLLFVRPVRNNPEPVPRLFNDSCYLPIIIPQDALSTPKTIAQFLVEL